MMRPVVIRVGLILSVVLGLGGLVVSQDLPPEMRADQYLMEGQRALEQEDPAAAVEAFKKLEALPGDPAAEFGYWYGQALVEHGISQSDAFMVTDGEGFLKQYLLDTGRESEHYANALALLSQAEGHGLPRPQLPANEVGPPTQAATIPEISPHVIKIAKQTKLDQCDNNLWGRWDCNSGGLILSHAFNNNGIEQVTLEKAGVLWGWDEKSYPVDRKWHPNTDTGKENSVSCNGWNDYGFRVLSILTRDAPGLRSAKYVDYYVNHKDVLWITYGEIRKDQNGKVTSEENYNEYCRRY